MSDRTTLVQRLREDAGAGYWWSSSGEEPSARRHMLEAAEELDRLQRELANAHELFDDDVIEEIFGPRCDEYEAGCAGCRAWRWHDAFLAGTAPTSGEAVAGPTTLYSRTFSTS